MSRIEIQEHRGSVVVVEDGRPLRPGARVSMTAPELAVMVNQFFIERSPVDGTLRTAKATVPVYRRFPPPSVDNGRQLPPSHGGGR